MRMVFLASGGRCISLAMQGCSGHAPTMNRVKRERRGRRVVPDSANQRQLAVAAVLGIHPTTVKKWHYSPGGLRARVHAWVLSQHATAIRQGGVV